MHISLPWGRAILLYLSELPIGLLPAANEGPTPAARTARRSRRTRRTRWTNTFAGALKEESLEISTFVKTNIRIMCPLSEVEWVSYDVALGCWSAQKRER